MKPEVGQIYDHAYWGGLRILEVKSDGFYVTTDEIKSDLRVFLSNGNLGFMKLIK